MLSLNCIKLSQILFVFALLKPSLKYILLIVEKLDYNHAVLWETLWMCVCVCTSVNVCGVYWCVGCWSHHSLVAPFICVWRMVLPVFLPVFLIRLVFCNSLILTRLWPFLLPRASPVLLCLPPCLHVAISICSFLLWLHIHQVYCRLARSSELALFRPWSARFSRLDLRWGWWLTTWPRGYTHHQLITQPVDGQSVKAEGIDSKLMVGAFHSQMNLSSSRSFPEQRGRCAAAGGHDESSQWALHGKRSLCNCNHNMWIHNYVLWILAAQ